MVRPSLLLAGAIFLIWLPYAGAKAQRMVEFGTPAAGASGHAAAPQVLRGAAIAPRPAPERVRHEAIRIEAGEGVWLIDRPSRRLVFCERNYGSQVGSRFVRCTRGRAPGRLAR